MSMFSSKTGTTESSAKDLDRVRLAKQKKPKKTKEKTVQIGRASCRERV